MKRIVLLLSLLIVCTGVQAQFSLTGSDPSKVRWMQMSSPEFRIIYPEGEDSLARVYGTWLEKARIGVSRSSGLLAGENYKSRMPVVLHSFNTIPNASVAWAPRRMDFFTAPDAYSPTPVPWEKLLAIHEGRHVSQMNAGVAGRNKVFKYLTGELFAGAFAGLYPGPTLLEGDAVVTETALTSSGRGRQASFLSYMMPAFESGDWRDYWKWSFGSHKYYSPDHYRAGYMLISGTRVFYDDPLFTKEYFDRTSGRGLFFNLQKTVRAASGKSLLRTFRTIEESYASIWAEEAFARGPFMPSNQVTPSPWKHTAYTGSVMAGKSGAWTVRSGLTDSPALVRLDPDGKISTVRPFSTAIGKLNFDKAGERLWWSETIAHPRWTLAGNSRIRFIDLSDPKNIHDLTKEGKYFNPAPSPDGSLVCVTEYPATGGSRLLLLDSRNGKIMSVVEAPDSVQFTESAWVGNKLFAAGLSDHGMGIYPVNDCHPERSEGSVGQPILPHQPVELSNLGTVNNKISFLCDRTGVNEMYILDVDSGKLFQVTSTRFGISAPFFSDNGDTLYYSSLAPSDRPEAYKQGLMIYSTAAADLPKKEVSFEATHPWKIADALSAQEKELAGNDEKLLPDIPGLAFSEPKRFRKLIPAIHSWAPFYFNYDNVENISGDESYKSASLGATVLFQNLVGDGYGFLGYNVHEDPDAITCDRIRSLRPSAHFKYLYTGLFPVIELSADLGDRASKDIMRVQQSDVTGGKVAIFTSRERKNAPFFEGNLRMYVPLRFNSGGLSRGLVPQLRFRFTNDTYHDRISLREVFGTEDNPSWKEIGSLGRDHISMLYTIDLSLRGFIMKDRAPSQAWPRLGIGAEAGVRTRPGHMAYFSNTAYMYLYGYLPGVLQDQGIKLGAVVGTDFGGGRFSYPDMPASFIPRGFAGTNISSISNSCSPFRYKVSFDYSLPLINLDWSWLCPVAYFKNIEVVPFADFSFQKFTVLEEYLINIKEVRSGSLASFGTDIVFHLGNLLWLPYDSSIGLRYACNTWKNIDSFPVKGLDHHYFGAIFSVSM